eukprot:Clim_evm32s11 gene=Clim_evmTU32s11
MSMFPDNDPGQQKAEAQSMDYERDSPNTQATGMLNSIFMAAPAAGGSGQTFPFNGSGVDAPAGKPFSPLEFNNALIPPQAGRPGPETPGVKGHSPYGGIVWSHPSQVNEALHRRSQEVDMAAAAAVAAAAEAPQQTRPAATTQDPGNPFEQAFGAAARHPILPPQPGAEAPTSHLPIAASGGPVPPFNENSGAPPGSAAGRATRRSDIASHPVEYGIGMGVPAGTRDPIRRSGRSLTMADVPTPQPQTSSLQQRRLSETQANNFVKPPDALVIPPKKSHGDSTADNNMVVTPSWLGDTSIFSPSALTAMAGSKYNHNVLDLAGKVMNELTTIIASGDSSGNDDAQNMLQGIVQVIDNSKKNPDCASPSALRAAVAAASVQDTTAISLAGTSTAPLPIPEAAAVAASEPPAPQAVAAPTQPQDAEMREAAERATPAARISPQEDEENLLRRSSGAISEAMLAIPKGKRSELAVGRTDSDDREVESGGVSGIGTREISTDTDGKSNSDEERTHAIEDAADALAHSMGMTLGATVTENEILARKLKTRKERQQRRLKRRMRNSAESNSQAMSVTEEGDNAQSENPSQQDPGLLNETPSEQKRREQRAKSRDAASRWRENKRFQLQIFKEENGILLAENESLHLERLRLRKEIIQLKEMLLEHRECNVTKGLITKARKTGSTIKQ